MDITKRLGERIRALRKSAGLTQAKLAEHAEMDPKYIGQIERAETNPTAKMLEKIANALNVSLADLFTFSPRVREEEFENIRVVDLLKDKSEETKRVVLKILKTLRE